MKNFKFISLLALIAVVFMGCPYKASVPISDATLKINEALIGKWENRTSTSDLYIVTKADDFHYLIEKTSTSGGESTKYKAHLSDVNGKLFLNVSEMSEYSSADYYFHQVELVNDNVFTLREVTDNIDETFETSEQLKSFIAANMNNSYFFNKDESTYIKMGKN